MSIHRFYMRAIAAEIGTSIHGMGAVRSFLVPESGIPAGWRKQGKDRMAPKATKLGKPWKDRMDAAPCIMTMDTLLGRCGMKQGFALLGGAFHEYSLGFAAFGDTIIVETLQNSDGSSFSGDPLDCERIPNSRYWLIREAIEGVS